MKARRETASKVLSEVTVRLQNPKFAMLTEHCGESGWLYCTVCSANTANKKFIDYNHLRSEKHEKYLGWAIDHQ